MAASIIIVSYNTKKLLFDCITSLYKYLREENFEIIVIDNNSLDGSVDCIAQSFPQVRFVLNTKNKGFGTANNQGIAIAKYDYVWLLNSDTIIEKNLQVEMEDFMDKHPLCAGVSPNIVYPDGEKQNVYGNYPTVLYYLLNSIGIFRLMPIKYRNKYSVGKPCFSKSPLQVPHIIGVSMFMRKDALNTVSGFDENFFLYFEETELCYRLSKLGYSFYVLPAIRIIHLMSKSSPSSKFKIENQLVSRMYYFRKINSRYLWVIKIISVFKLIVFSIKEKDKSYLNLYKKIV